MYVWKGDKVIRKPLRMLIAEHVTYEFNDSGLTVREFAKKYGVPPTTIQKLRYVTNDSISSHSVDVLLQQMNVSLVDLINKYDEYIDPDTTIENDD